MPSSKDQFVATDIPPIDADGPLRLAFSDPERTPSFYRWLSANATKNSVILLSEDIWEELDQAFPLNAKFTSLRSDLNLQVRVGECPTTPLLLMTDSQIVMGVGFADSLRFVPVTDEEAGRHLGSDFKSVYADGEPVSTDVPSWSELLAQLEERVGTETRDEYRRLISAAESSDLTSLDEVSVALIAAALSGALNYEISSWGEEMNVASKATFSRRKKELEEQGVIVTERVRVDVGRPRQRLRIDSAASGVDLEIGVEEEDIGIGEIDEPDPSESQTSDPTDDEESQPDGSETDSDSADDFIDILDEELQEVIADDGGT
ncbi:hypothetical protein [Halosimplex amylolyticum]|uniref:hypothetical protein n=1 Tax=Halosimplex amylolyticum TaxID=3396616 RepID=UPI003F57EF6A